MTSLLLLALAIPRQGIAPQEAAAPQETVAPQEAVAPKPSVLLGKMLGRYANASALSGKFTWYQVATATTGKAEETVTTEFALERPSRLRIAQKSTRYPQKPFVFTSDGSEFSFDVPDLTAPAGFRLVEPVMKPEGPLDVGRLLAAARKSMPDVYSPFLTVAGAAKWDFENLKGEWASLQDGGEGEVSGVACRIIKGKWRPVATQAVNGTFGIWVTTDGELLKYATEQSFDVADDDKKPLGKVTVLSTWTGRIAVNPEIPSGTFAVVK